MFKITQTDHGQQSFVLFPRIKIIIRAAMDALCDDTTKDSLIRDQALQLKRFIENPENEDKPVLFTKSHGSMMNCPDCCGTRNARQMPEDRNEEVEFIACKTCKGEGQLYYEIIHKYYVPTEYHRRKLTK